MDGVFVDTGDHAVAVDIDLSEVIFHTSAEVQAVFNHMRCCNILGNCWDTSGFCHFEIISLRLMRSSLSFLGEGLLRVRDSATVTAHVSAIPEERLGSSLWLDIQALYVERLSLRVVSSKSKQIPYLKR